MVGTLRYGDLIQVAASLSYRNLMFMSSVLLLCRRVSRMEVSCHTGCCSNGKNKSLDPVRKFPKAGYSNELDSSVYREAGDPALR